ncbi:hypothetical protein [Polycyclovorans algicola]|uniref:hypothetical protein n=1 Tax=Polycyclovorans algicola TaxID=616992 RepID=UPI0004A752D7|nr:hypothetical protein [Polycyclovorans algicola]
MINIERLMDALPVSGLSPARIACLSGIVEGPNENQWRHTINLIEPPAGMRGTPFVNPRKALEVLLLGQGLAEQDATWSAQEAVGRMRSDLGEDLWIVPFDFFDPDPDECIPVQKFVSWLRNEHLADGESVHSAKSSLKAVCGSTTGPVLVPRDLLDFIEKAAEVTRHAAIFRGPDSPESGWSLETLPPVAPPQAMIEFVPGPPWPEEGDFDNWNDVRRPIWRWRESIRAPALALERALGEAVYYFADPRCDHDDDAAHRFLLLHWCCSTKPESAYVRYLLKISGGRDVEELKAALIEPTAYRHPYKMNCAFYGLDPLICRFEYVPPETRKRLVIVFSTPESRNVAEWLLEQKINMDVCIVAPQSLATEEWIDKATRNCRTSGFRYQKGKSLKEPLETLALADELCVIANERTPSSGFDLMLPDDVEDLLWLSLELGIKCQYFYVDRRQLNNPKTSLAQRGAAERVAVRQNQRSAFTRRLSGIRIECDFGSSGLWTLDGKMLPYDLVDLPFSLIQQIARWQYEYDATFDPPNHVGSDEWWERHRQKAVELTEALQEALQDQADRSGDDSVIGASK